MTRRTARRIPIAADFKETCLKRMVSLKSGAIGILLAVLLVIADTILGLLRFMVIRIIIGIRVTRIIIGIRVLHSFDPLLLFVYYGGVYAKLQAGAGCFVLHLLALFFALFVGVAPHQRYRFQEFWGSYR